MKILKTKFDRVIVLEPVIYKDTRGYFFESWNRKTLENLGLKYDWVQDNQSKSVYGTVRGIHYQRQPHTQTKLIQVLQGTIRDVVVDLRAESPTYGQHLAVELTQETHQQLLIPKGFGHGYSVLSETAVIAYKCDDFYTPDAERGIHPFDAELAIDWRIDSAKAILSDKDARAQSFEQYQNNPDFHLEG